MLLILVLAFPLSLVAIWATSERRRLVREAPLPYFLKQKLVTTYPHLTLRDAELVERGLRQFFTACQRSNKRFVAMPSQVVDSMWHEFILHTSAYREWCDLVIGRFIDHVPAEVLGRKASTNDGLRRAWFWSCRDESINPKQPSRLPLLFALDAKFAIPGGFVYLADCRGVRRDGEQAQAQAYCGESFSDGSYSGDADGFGGSESSSSNGDSSGSSSDGSSGCGSGCGGGGD
ncbi:glycine-rich domain-containing protein [Polaromonas sp. YR568]|uniref:glycine-rich domain-containing protein n=1 Tax=Polaromonas sp. YR568 TaxID=1855301 RepID=UPI00398C12F3